MSQPTPQPLSPAVQILLFYLLDTNILLRLSDPNSAQHQAAKDAVANLVASGAVLFITPQNLIEFWDAATRTKLKNGLALTPNAAQNEIATHKATFRLLPDNANILPEWERLASIYQVEGRNVHDTRLAAVALVYKVPNFLTFNIKHFRHFTSEGLTAIDPATVKPPALSAPPTGKATK
jgi:predicted nucleic acid-binding protein